jgi:hypothetical protein
MPKNEPQSYGSQDDWLTGKTGQKVNDPKSTPQPEHQVFYENLHEDEASGSEGGKLSPVQLAENPQTGKGGSGTDTPTQKVPDKEGGAKRGSFFKDRDYK